MSLLLPLLVTVAIVAIYLLRPPPRPVVVPSTVLWRRLLAEERPLLERLRWLLSLLLALVIGLALAFALRQAPWWSGATGEHSLTLVVDTRPTMAARTTTGERRLDLARRRARAAVLAAPSGSRFRLVTPGMPATGWLDEPGMLEELDEVTIDWRGRDSLPLLPAPEGRHQTIVLTDGVGPPLLAAAHDTMEARQVSVYEPAVNVGISAFATGLDPSSGAAIAYLELVYTGERAASVRIQVADPGGIRLERRVELAGEGDFSTELWSATLSLADWQPGLLEATVELEGATADALPEDDRAFALLSDRRPRLALVGNPGEAVERALEAWGDPEIVRLDDAERLETRLETQAPPADVDAVIWSRRAPSRPPDRPALLLAPPPAPWLRLGSTGTAGETTELLDGVDPTRLEGVRPRSLPTDPEGDLQGLGRTNEAPLLATRAADPAAQEARTVVLLADPADPELVRSAAFPILVANALDWLTARPSVTLLAAAENGDDGVQLEPGRRTATDGGSVVAMSVEDRDASAVNRRRVGAPSSSRESDAPLVDPLGDDLAETVEAHGLGLGPLALLGIALGAALFELLSFRRRWTL